MVARLAARARQAGLPIDAQAMDGDRVLEQLGDQLAVPSTALLATAVKPGG